MMTILYRRFFLVVALIACMGVSLAHLIQQTRPTIYDHEARFPSISKPCNVTKTCQIDFVPFINNAMSQTG